MTLSHRGPKEGTATVGRRASEGAFCRGIPWNDLDATQIIRAAIVDECRIGIGFFTGGEITVVEADINRCAFRLNEQRAVGNGQGDQ